MDEETRKLQWNLKLSVIKMLFSKDTFIQKVDVEDLAVESNTATWTIVAQDNRENPGL